VVTMVNWVFFRAESLGHATGILSALAGLNQPVGVVDGLGAFIDPFALTILVVGIVGAFPVANGWIGRDQPVAPTFAGEALRLAGYVAVLIAVLVLVAVKTYTPFIYQQF
jgi:alginate O-acetyltransferase complex protein AlgI